jgi:hypothetical protein
MGDAIIPVKDVGAAPEIKSLKLINPDSGKFEGEVREGGGSRVIVGRVIVRWEGGREGGTRQQLLHKSLVLLLSFLFYVTSHFIFREEHFQGSCFGTFFIIFRMYT